VTNEGKKMAIVLSPLVHIEIVVPDAEVAYRFLHQTFGARKVQEDIAGFLENEVAGKIPGVPPLRIIHVGLGDVVLQFIEPLTAEGSWFEQLETSGAGVHNLSFRVENVRATVATIEKEGIVPVNFFPIEWEALIPPEHIKSDIQPVFMMDTKNQLGFHLELIESPFREPPTKEYKYATGANELIGEVSPMLHISLCAADAKGTFQFLNRVFGSEKVEQTLSSFLDSESLQVTHMNLSNVVLQYCQPRIEEGLWYEQLQRRGYSVCNLAFWVEKMERIKQAVEAAGRRDLFTFSLDLKKLLGKDAREDVPPVHIVDTMDILGFNLELSEWPGKGELDFLFGEVGPGAPNQPGQLGGRNFGYSV